MPSKGLRIIAACVAPAIISSLTVQAGQGNEDAGIVVADCYVSLLKDIEVPAEAPGVIVALKVQAGDDVEAEELLANTDDRQAQANRRLANIELTSATEQAENDIRVRYAREDAKVSKADLDAALKARAGAFGAAEIRKMKLQLSRSTLGIEQAILEQNELGHTASAAAAKLDAAEEEIKRRAIRAPFAGVVIEVRTKQGEWASPGDPLLRLVQMDHLSVDGFLNIARHGQQVREGMRIKATVNTGTQQVEADGVVSFVSPVVQAGGDYRVRAEVTNWKSDGHWALRPGLAATFRVLRE